MLSNLHNIYAKLIVFLGAFFVIAIITIFTSNNPNIKPIIVEKEVIPSQNYFEDLSLEAKAVFVWDVNKQESLYASNEEAQLPLASLTKLMTAVIAVDTLPESSVVTIDNNDLTSAGDSGLYANEKWSFKDLLKFTLIVSSNDGANALANVAGLLKSSFPSQKEDNKKAFVYAMNNKVKDIGLTQTYFINPTGLDTNESISGGYGSARDAVKLLEYAIINVPEIIESTRHTELEFSSLSDIKHTATNTNSSISFLPGLIASKTGYTDLAGGNLVIAFDAGMNRPIIISVLGSTQDGRFSDVEKLVSASLKSLNPVRSRTRDTSATSNGVN